METLKENDVSPIVYAAARDEIIYCICAKAYYSSFSIVKNVLSSSVLVLLTGFFLPVLFVWWPYMPCFLEQLVTVLPEVTPITNENFEHHHHSYSEVKDLSIRSCTIHSKFLFNKSAFFGILGPGVCVNGTLLRSIFKMQISSYPHLPNSLPTFSTIS